MQYYDKQQYSEAKAELQKKLRKLESNLRQMTPEQKIKYKSALDKLKKEISGLWNQVLNLSQTKVTMPTNSSEAKKAQQLWEESYSGKIKKLLYSEFNMDAALECVEAFKLDVVITCHGFYSIMQTEEESKAALQCANVTVN